MPISLIPCRSTNRRPLHNSMTVRSIADLALGRPSDKPLFSIPEELQIGIGLSHPKISLASLAFKPRYRHPHLIACHMGVRQHVNRIAAQRRNLIVERKEMLIGDSQAAQRIQPDVCWQAAILA